ETASRGNSEITLAEAIQDANNGVAQALTFIATEQGSRTTADSAIAESIDLVAATLGGDVAAVNTTMSAQINALTGEVDAMWTAQVNVNGLVGGFGLHGGGGQIQAGFDVDTFWVGRTGANNRKPFIVFGTHV